MNASSVHIFTGFACLEYDINVCAGEARTWGILSGLSDKTKKGGAPEKNASPSLTSSERLSSGARETLRKAAIPRFLIQQLHRHRFSQRIDSELQRLNCGHTRDGRQ